MCNLHSWRLFHALFENARPTTIGGGANSILAFELIVFECPWVHDRLLRVSILLTKARGVKTFRTRLPASGRIERVTACAAHQEHGGEPALPLRLRDDDAAADGVRPDGVVGHFKVRAAVEGARLERQRQPPRNLAHSCNELR